MRLPKALAIATCALGCGRVDFDPIPLKRVDVVAAFQNATRWNDYITLVSTDPLFLQPDATCDIYPPTEVADCVQAGIVKKVTLDVASCAGATAVDSSAALQWACDDASGTAVLYSTGFAPGKGLADLVGSTAWKLLSVRVDLDGTPYAESEPATWWSNPVRPLPETVNAALTLADPGTIYVLDASRASAGYLIDADGIAIVIAHGATLSASPIAPNCDNVAGGGSTRSCLVATTARQNLWIEGDLDVASNAEVGVLLSGAIYSRIHGTRVVSARAENVLLFGATGNFVDDLFVANAGGDGLALRAMSFANAAVGVRAFGNGTLGNAGTAGLRIDESPRSSFAGLTVANNHDHGVMTSGTNAFGNTFAFVTAINNTLAGLELQGSGVDTVVNAFVANQPIGISLAANGQLGGELVVTDNGVGLCGADAQPPDLFDSVVFGANATDCMQGASCTTPIACSTWGGTQVQLTSGVDPTGALAGKVLSEDSVNSSDVSGAATAVTDWTHFAGPLRGWGADGGNYPDPGNRAPCGGGGSCRIWDMSTIATPALATRDETGTTESETVVGGQPCPSALAPMRSVADWIGSELDPDAFEVIGDGYGDDDGLCEQHEHCTYSTRYGADQGTPAAITSPACVYATANQPRWIHGP